MSRKGKQNDILQKHPPFGADAKANLYECPLNQSFRPGDSNTVSDLFASDIGQEVDLIDCVL